MLGTMKRRIQRGLAWSRRQLGALLGVASMAAFVLSACSPEERQFETTSASGSGGGGGCAPNEERSCYSGPPGTEDVGLCKMGIQVCLPNGSGFGECSAEVVPQTENCLTPEDEACNGDEPTDCPPLDHVWSKGFPIGQEFLVRGVAVDPKTQDFVIAGEMRGILDLGGGPLASTGSSDILLAKFGPDGTHRWSKRFGDASSQSSESVVIDDAGMIYIAGTVAGAIDLGNGMPLTSAGSNDALVAKFNPDGVLVWGKLFGDVSAQRAKSVALTKAGQVVVGGDFGGTIDLGGAVLTAPTDTDIFVARLDTSGFHAMSRRFGGTGVENLAAIAVDTNDDIILTGEFDGALDFVGAGMFTSAGLDDVFVAKLAGQNGTPIWARSWGDASDQEGLALTIAPNNEVVIAGQMAGIIDFGTGSALEAPPNATQMYLAKLSPEGVPVWSKIMGGPNSDNGWSVSLGVANGHIVTAGWFSDQVDFGGGPLLSTAEVSPFIAKLALDGKHASSRTYTVKMPSAFTGLGLLPKGDPILVGLSYGPIDLGGGTLQPNNAQEVLLFLARLLP